MDLCLGDAGVWDEHAAVHFDREDGFFVESAPEAIVAVNGDKVTRCRLRNGDHLDCGSVKLQFWLAAVRQQSLRPREALTWVALGGLCLIELWIIYRLAV
jgi:hypothetical protein